MSTPTSGSITAYPTAPPAVALMPRLDSVDLLRGLVMVIMALDHTRDFFHYHAFLFDPTNLERTWPTLFFTRWITHFCAPLFVFLAGTGAYLSLSRGKTKADLTRFLLTRGLWLIVLELTVIRFAWTLTLQPGFYWVQVIWAIGVGMIVLAALIRLPVWAIGVFGIVMIAGHNLLDGFNPQSPFGLKLLWAILHRPDFFQFPNGMAFFPVYSLIPWVGVLAAGYAFGAFLTAPGDRRKRLVVLGSAMIGTFLLLRAFNLYGDPLPWSEQKNAIFSVMSFLNTQKYPPSLLFLLMTLGPGMLFLAAFDRFRADGANFLARATTTFGRVPMFYYLWHVIIIHLLAIAAAYLRWGPRGPGMLPNPLAVPAPGYGWACGRPTCFGSSRSPSSIRCARGLPASSAASGIGGWDTCRSEPQRHEGHKGN